MTAGHFGFAAAIKSISPRTPLWALMVATYFLDIVFIFLAGAGLESFAQIDPAHPAYGGAIIHAGYTHSLVGAALISLVVGAVATAIWNRSSGVILGAVVFSHWLLDLVVHRPDMAILPANVGNFPLLGLGLWSYPAISAVLELVLAVGGAWLYYRSAARAPSVATEAGTRFSKAIMAAGVTGALIVLLLAADVFSLPLLLAVGLMLMVIVVGGLLDARLGWGNWASPAG